MTTEEKDQLLGALRSNRNVVPDLNGLLCKIIEALPTEDVKPGLVDRLKETFTGAKEKK